MNERRKIIVLIGIMTAVGIVIGALMLDLLYKASLEQQRERLVENAYNQARMVETIAIHERETAKTHPEQAGDAGFLEAMLHQVESAHRHFQGFGKTGEIRLGQRKGDRIVFLLGCRHENTCLEGSVPFDSDPAEPMRRALRGERGWYAGPDCRGVEVLAAYEPVPEFDLGIVSKMDLAEIRAPFKQAALLAGAIGGVVLLAGILLFLRVGGPMARRLEETVRRLEGLLDTIPSPVFFKNMKGRYLGCNEAFARDVLGVAKESIIGRSVEEMPEGIPRNMADLCRRKDEELMRSGGIQAFEGELACRDGVRKTFSFNKAVYSGTDGPAGIVGVMVDVTGRKQAEQAAQHERHRFFQVLEALPAFVYVLSSDYVIRYANQKFRDFFGDPLSSPCHQVIHGRKEPCEACASFQAPDQAAPRQWQWRQADGRTYEVHQIPIHAEDGMPLLLEMGIDITDNLRAAEALRESEERFRLAFKHSGIGMALLSSDGRFLAVNGAVGALLGYTAEELQTLRFMDITHAEDLERNIAAFRDIVSGARESYCIEKRYIRRDGSAVWVLVAATMVRDESGAPREMVVQIQDLTERKRAEKIIQEHQQELEKTVQRRTRELGESKKMLQQVLDNFPHYLFWKDRDLMYLGCNQNFARAAGFERSEAIAGKSDFDLPWRPEEAESFRACDRRVMEEGRPELHLIESLKRADGRQAWLDMNKVPLSDADGNVIGVLGMYEDITDRILAEEELRVAKERAVAANQAKNVFLANVSHELRTPLHGILSFSSFGMKKCGPGQEKLLEYFTRIHRNGETLLALVNDLLDLEKLESGKMVFEFANADLQHALKTVLSELSSLMVEKKLVVELTNEMPQDVAVFDEEKIRRVLRNLLSNAIRFSPSGGRIEVNAKGRGALLRVSIRDEGPGIPEDELESVFDKFVQSRKNPHSAGGTGLGLAICREIITAHKGRIWARNCEQVGAELIFEIPLDPRAPAASPTAGPHARAHGSPVPAIG